jgi:hypothetical protein
MAYELEAWHIEKTSQRAYARQLACRRRQRPAARRPVLTMLHDAADQVLVMVALDREDAIVEALQ